MRCLLTTLIAAVEVAPGLLIVKQIQDLAEPIEELSLSTVGCSMNDDAVGLALFIKYEVLADVLDEVVMLCMLKEIYEIFQYQLFFFNSFNVLAQILSDVW